MIAGLREEKLSRNRKVKVRFFSWSKNQRFLLLFSSYVEEETGRYLATFWYKLRSLQK